MNKEISTYFLKNYFLIVLFGLIEMKNLPGVKKKKKA